MSLSVTIHCANPSCRKPLTVVAASGAELAEITEGRTDKHGVIQGRCVRCAKRYAAGKKNHKRTGGQRRK